ncbi:CAP-associated domain-containing protein [Neobacillus sp. DY30]|uniref:CAP-associated domain-containing protein n=1 Tax=Neobacillus sp. DY30 TaxID=3047871 RepID=UPI0024BF7368|nr:CAP-associated domain-containing protein [Neobacillus sp. DY30]WHX98379.1 CAP-associated domain-containing protein [Neobacillus sp. DY30]
MFRLLRFIALLFLLYISWPFITKQLDNSDIHANFVTTLKENIEVPETISVLYDDIQQMLKALGFQLEEMPLTQQKSNEAPPKKVELTPPTQQTFSIHNIELGNTKSDIEHNLGLANRISLNEYGTNWHAYHANYHNFFMVMYDNNNQAAGLYTNQDLLTSTNGIKIGTSLKESVRNILGEPITKVQKGMVIYQLQEESDNDLFLLDDAYVTIFYDKHENNTVTAIQIISKTMEDHKKDFYTEASQSLKEGFEYQMFDLTNAARVNHQLPILTWDDHVRETAREHSADMAENDYFDHKNLEGQSPFDRMKEDAVAFHTAGENLAYGQLSSIFAHEGLMNSLGHRENILRQDYEYLGVGVAFNEKSQPYYTQNYYAN